MKTTIIATLIASAAMTATVQAQSIDDAEIRQLAADTDRAYQAYAGVDGCNADYLTPTLAAYCWGRKTGAVDPNPTGGAIGASIN